MTHVWPVSIRKCESFSGKMCDDKRGLWCDDYGGHNSIECKELMTFKIISGRFMNESHCQWPCNHWSLNLQVRRRRRHDNEAYKAYVAVVKLKVLCAEEHREAVIVGKPGWVACGVLVQRKSLIERFSHATRDLQRNPETKMSSSWMHNCITKAVSGREGWHREWSQKIRWFLRKFVNI